MNIKPYYDYHLFDLSDEDLVKLKASGKTPPEYKVRCGPTNCIGRGCCWAKIVADDGFEFHPEFPLAKDSKDLRKQAIQAAWENFENRRIAYREKLEKTK